MVIKSQLDAISLTPGPKGDTGPAPEIVSFATDAEAAAYSASHPTAIVFSTEGSGQEAMTIQPTADGFIITNIPEVEEMTITPTEDGFVAE